MAAKTLYFRNLQGGAPTGSWELREVFPTGAEDATSTHGSCANCSGALKSVIIKPGASNSTFVSGLPETNAPPDAGDQFGWFTSGTYSGTFSAANWTFQYRHDDNRSQVTGHPVFNVYKTTLETFGGTWTFLFQTESANDWWTNTTSTQSHTVNPGSISVSSNFLFVNVWCHEHTNDGGRTHHFRVEGSALAESTVSKIITADLVEPAENELHRIHTELPQLDATYTFLLHSFQGWQQSPLSADAPPEENQETINRRWTELPSEAYDALFGHDFQGFQLSPTPDDFFAGNVHTHIAIPCYVPVNRDYTFTLQPLSDDAVEENQETINRGHYDLPIWNIKYLGHSFDGWSQQPLADDNEESATRIWDANPEVRHARPLFDFTWTFNVTPDDVEDTVLGDETRASDVPWGRDKNAYDGFQLAPTPDDFTEEAVSREHIDLPPWVRDRHLYDGFQSAPLSEDTAADEPLSQAVTDLAPIARDRHSYDGFLAAPLEVVVDEPLPFCFYDLAPVSSDRHDYGGFSTQPTPDDVVVAVETVYNLATTGIGL